MILSIKTVLWKLWQKTKQIKCAHTCESTRFQWVEGAVQQERWEAEGECGGGGRKQEEGEVCDIPTGQSDFQNRHNAFNLASHSALTILFVSTVLCSEWMKFILCPHKG